MRFSRFLLSAELMQMGFYLLHESMLESVIVARDRWLKQGGLLLPDRAVICAAPVNVNRFVGKHALYWNDVYGFDMSVLAAAAYGSFHTKPQITQLRGDEILATPRVVSEFALHSVTQQQLASVTAQLQFTIDHDVTVHAFALWFDVAFPDGSILATGPANAKTHWKQTLVFMPQPVTLPAGFELACDVAMQQDEHNRRHYAVQLALPDVQGDVLDDEQMEIEAALCHSECECAKVSACRVVVLSCCRVVVLLSVAVQRDSRVFRTKLKRKKHAENLVCIRLFMPFSFTPCPHLHMRLVSVSGSEENFRVLLQNFEGRSFARRGFVRPRTQIP
jgi:hypothetical protein